ncbi:MAG: metallophosphoesterase [Oscillospiraceae bacterium]|nr:metallophosphoesterase [Oscillospiraceae bacterium]
MNLTVLFMLVILSLLLCSCSAAYETTREQFTTPEQEQYSTSTQEQFAAPEWEQFAMPEQEQSAASEQKQFATSEQWQFTTPFAQETLFEQEEAPFVFLFMSDTQPDPQVGDYGGLNALLTQALAHFDGENKPGLMLLGGDTVNDGSDESEWASFWQAVGASLDGIPIAAAVGNHDNKTLIAEQFTWPDAAPVRPGQGFFYSFDMNGVHFTVLDSNILGAANEEDIVWLEADLSSQTAMEADWRVVLCHHPFFPAANIPKDVARAQTMRENFLPTLEQFGVDLLLVGHQHMYSRSLPMSGGGQTPRGIVQVMAASGDKADYTPETDQSYLAVTAPAPNFALISANDDTLTVTAYGSSGEVIDYFSLSRISEGADAADATDMVSR